MNTLLIQLTRSQSKPQTERDQELSPLEHVNGLPGRIFLGGVSWSCYNHHQQPVLGYSMDKNSQPSLNPTDPLPPPPKYSGPPLVKQ